MSEQVKRNTDDQSFQEQQKKVVVSIVLSESTMSELQLNLPFVEDFEGESSSQTVKSYIRKSTSSLYNLNKLFVSNNTLKEQMVITNIGYFSSKVTDPSSSSETREDADDASKSSSDDKLKQGVICTHPFLPFNSAANEGSINCKCNNIYVSVLGRQESSKWLNICRICHCGESNGDLLSPCHCRGSIALAHMECVERWLKESTNSHCELCRYHYTIVRKPKYGILQSVFVFVLHPSDRFWELVLDAVGFMIYTTATVLSTYTLSVLCTSATRSTTPRFGSLQIIGLCSLLGISLIEFTYTLWLLDSLKKHVSAWEAWYHTNCDLKVILSKRMSEQVKRNTDHQSSQEQQKNVVVSIVLSESTTSELQLNLPFIEDFESESSVTRKSASSVYNLNKSFESNNSLKKRRVSTDTAYFSSKLTDSSSSLEIDKNADDVDNSSSDEAHEGSIDYERNNIYLSILGRHESTESLNICRICHGGESIGDLLSPCNCRGSMALAHIECLERWLKESTNSHCELCRYHYTIVREPKYEILQSIFVFILHSGDRLRDLVLDITGFIICTTATVLSTYTLSVLSTSAVRTTTHIMFDSPQIIEFSSVLGIALIECVYTSWFLDSLKKHLLAWEAWYRTNSDLKVILSKSKQHVRCEIEDSE